MSNSRWPVWAGVVAVLLVIVVVTAWAAGRQGASTADAPDGFGAVRLGPAAGEGVAGYLARARTVVPGPGPRLALVQFDRAADAASAAGALAASGATPLQAVLRVPIPRVQTAVRRETVIGTGSVSDGVAGAEEQAAADAGVEAGAVPSGPMADRSRAIARAEAAALRARCACVLALVVRLDSSTPGARTLITGPASTTAPGTVGPPLVRAVEVAPPDAKLGALAISPLLPEQRDLVGPVPDDGPVPT